MPKKEVRYDDPNFEPKFNENGKFWYYQGKSHQLPATKTLTMLDSITANQASMYMPWYIKWLGLAIFLLLVLTTLYSSMSAENSQLTYDEIMDGIDVDINSDQLE